MNTTLNLSTKAVDTISDWIGQIRGREFEAHNEAMIEAAADDVDNHELHHEIAARAAADLDRLATAMVTMMRLGGDVIAESDTMLHGVNDTIAYGIVLDPKTLSVSVHS